MVSIPTEEELERITRIDLLLSEGEKLKAAGKYWEGECTKWAAAWERKGLELERAERERDQAISQAEHAAKQCEAFARATDVWRDRAEELQGRLERLEIRTRSFINELHEFPEGDHTESLFWLEKLLEPIAAPAARAEGEG